MGGYDSSSHLATVEKYEPQVRNTPQSHEFPFQELLEVIALFTHITQMISPLGPTPSHRYPILE